MHRLPSLIATGLVLVTLNACGPKVEPPPRSGPPTPMPDFTLNDLEGHSFSSQSLQGKIVILHFCASWSPTSAREIRQLNQIQETYAKKGVQVLGIALEEDQGSDMHAFAKVATLNYPMLIAPEDFHRKFGGIDAIPSTFMIDPQGQIMNRYTGFVGAADMTADVKRMIQERDDAAKLAGK